MISKSYNLETLVNPAIKFSWAGAAINSSPLNTVDIKYSVQCGTWLPLGSLTAIEAARSGYIGGIYLPTFSVSFSFSTVHDERRIVITRDERIFFIQLYI